MLEFINKLKVDISLEKEIFLKKDDLNTFYKRFGILYNNL